MIDLIALEKVLTKVQKPARYVGGESNLSAKVWDSSATNFCFCFPDLYEVGMSNLGLKILHEILNNMEGIVSERCFLPWIDMIEEMEKSNIPLFSLESKTELGKFDVIAFSVQSELCFSNMVKMLQMAKIPLFSKDRTHKHPIIIAGGPCAYNFEPIADFLDIASIGDGEDVIKEIATLINNAKTKKFNKQEILASAKNIQGLFVPCLMETKQENNWIVPCDLNTVKKAIVLDLDKVAFPACPMLPSIEIVHDRAVVELFRGCTHGCRFCQAGFTYRPIREKQIETIVDQSVNMIQNTGYEELSLSSLSTSDYSHIKELFSLLNSKLQSKHVRVSLPSLRITGFDEEFVSAGRISSLTFAPEAGSQRLRNVINKNVTEQQILDTLTKVFSIGYSSIKLYFMIGLPTETNEDLEEMIALARKIKWIYKNNKTSSKSLSLNFSASVFIPKPFTPFQWEQQIDLEEMKRRQWFLKDSLKKIGVGFQYHDSKTSVFECILARGDRSLSKAIVKAVEMGCIFDGWSECFDFEKWQTAFEECNIPVSRFLNSISTHQTLPWDYIDIGVTKQFLISEKEKAYTEALTPDCRNGCHLCGLGKTCALLKMENKK